MIRLLIPSIVLIVWIINFYLSSFLHHSVFDKDNYFLFFPAALSSFIHLFMPFIFIFHLRKSLNWHYKNQLIIKPKTLEIVIVFILGLLFLSILESFGYSGSVLNIIRSLNQPV